MANNVKGPAPNILVAKAAVSFVDAGINSTNTAKIFLITAELKSYIPGRSINGVDAFEINKGYYIVAKIPFDLSAYTMPPIEEINALLLESGSRLLTEAGEVLTLE